MAFEACACAAKGLVDAAHKGIKTDTGRPAKRIAVAGRSKQITLRHFHRSHPRPATPLDARINGAVSKPQ